MKCDVTGRFNIVNIIPKNYELLVGILDDPELEKIARVLIHGGEEVIPHKFFEIIPDLDKILDVESAESSFELFTIPARDFLSATEENYKYSWQDTLNKFLKQYGNEYIALCKLGELIVNQMKSVIEYNDWIENGWIESTYKKLTGGDPRPLIDTGHMLNSIRYEVKEV